MFDEASQLRMKAEASRRLADLSDDAERKMLWLERADHWAQLAIKAAKQPQRRKPRGAAGRNLSITSDRLSKLLRS